MLWCPVLYRHGNVNVKLAPPVSVLRLTNRDRSFLVGLHSRKIYAPLIGLVLVVLGVQMYFRRCAKRYPRRPGKAAYYAILSGLMIGIGGLSGGGVIMAGLLAMGEDMVGTVATN